MSPIRSAIARIGRSSSSRTVYGRLADVHMWEVRGVWTARAQAFRDEVGRTFVVITCRVGDRGTGPINGAELLRAEAWAQFFPGEQVPPTLVANVLNPDLRLKNSPQVATLEFDDAGNFRSHQGTDLADVTTLNLLGVQWDEGDGFAPCTPPPPRYVDVWRLFPVKDLPNRHLFRDMTRYMAADWGKAVQAAVLALQDGSQVLDEVSPTVSDAARTLLYEPVEIRREDGEIYYINGQHRTEAMLRQGVEETVLRETRHVEEPPPARL